MSSSWRLGVPIIGITLVLDQFSKVLAERLLPLHQELVVLPFFSLVLTYNPGAAFGVLSEAGGWQRWFLSVLSIAIIAWILRWIHRAPTSDRLLISCLALIAGGAVGNLIDRLVAGSVTDFIALHYQQWYWPTFNLADAVISLGAIGLLCTIVRSGDSN